METEITKTDGAGSLRSVSCQELKKFKKYVEEKEQELISYYQEEATDGGTTPNEVGGRFNNIRGKYGEARQGKPDSIGYLESALDNKSLNWTAETVADFKKNINKMRDEIDEYIKEFKNKYPSKGGNGYGAAFIPL